MIGSGAFAPRRPTRPRLNGEDKAHIARLAETETPLPPILVDRRTMRVIDGMHRLMAASLQGRETIDVIFFDGSEADVFLRAVQENVTHGLPLSQADRRAAAERIIASHPHMSDRAIGHSVGLAAKTVAAIRKSSSEDMPQSNARVGRDGRVRPLDSGDGPAAGRRAPGAAAGRIAARRGARRGHIPGDGSRRAQAAGARRVAGTGEARRVRCPQGLPARPARSQATSQRRRLRPGHPLQSARAVGAADPAATVEKLLRDPSLRNNERGKGMLRLLHVNAVGAEQLPDAAAAVPPHCVGIVVQLARQYADDVAGLRPGTGRAGADHRPVGRHSLSRPGEVPR